MVERWSMTKRAWLLLIVLALAAGCQVVPGQEAPRPADWQPPGFSDTLVASVELPTALAFTPDGRLLVTTQPGVVHVIQGGELLPRPALDLSALVCTERERGMLGVAVDPQFAANHYVYLYYTFKKFGGCDIQSPKVPVNRVSRFTLPDGNVIDPASEFVLVDNILSYGGTHNAGDLKFDRDGYLYISIGDGGRDYAERTNSSSLNQAARDQNMLLGKILRITTDGGIPPGNPYQGPDSAPCRLAGRTDPGKKCRETFAWGLRNPFRLAFDPNAAETRFFINVTGQGAWEAIDLGQAGADYGWNIREGHCARDSTTDCGPPPPGMTNPIYDYQHGECGAITGGVFVPRGIWPPDYDDAYLFGDFICGKIFTLTPDRAGGYARGELRTGLGAASVVSMIFGPDGAGQALYYTSYAGGGQVRRIAYSCADCPPSPTSLSRLGSSRRVLHER